MEQRRGVIIPGDIGDTGDFDYTSFTHCTLYIVHCTLKKNPLLSLTQKKGINVIDAELSAK